MNWIFKFVKQAADSVLGRSITFRGDYTSWEEACNASTGYDEVCILKKVRDAVREVKAGRAVFERDSVLFHSPEYVWPVLSCLNFAAARNNGRLKVFDFGGSLGSFYFQHIAFLDLLATEWTVIEQAHYVEVGNEEFATSGLRFTTAVDRTDEEISQSTLLLSGVLHYLPNPTETVENLLSRPWAMVIIDRTPFISERSTDRLTVQTVPSEIYKASYPAWFFARDAFMQRCKRHLNPLASWQSFDRYWLDGDVVATEGYCFIRKNN
jgi:putative methyltransferase (TIGR04325 family)